MVQASLRERLRVVFVGKVTVFLPRDLVLAAGGADALDAAEDAEEADGSADVLAAAVVDATGAADVPGTGSVAVTAVGAAAEPAARG